MEFKKARQEGCYSVKITAAEGATVLGWGLLVGIANERHAEPYGLMENVYVEREHRG